MNMKKKFLMTATVPSMIGQFNMENIKVLLALGYEVYVGCNFKDRSVWTEERTENFEKQLSELGVKKIQIQYARSPYKIIELMKSYLQLQKIIKRERFVCLHCHTPVAGMISRLAARKTNTKIIYTAHGFHFYKGAPLANWILYYPIEKILSYYTDVLITINKEDYQRAKKKFHAKEIRYIPGVGIDVKKIQSTSVESDMKRKEIGICEKDFLLLSVGELNKNKNHEVVIRALAKLNNSRIKYVICGKGELKDYLKKLADELGLGNQVKILGYRKDVIQICKISNVFVFPSQREGLSVALMEAMACELPCLVTKIRGNVDLIEEGKNGFFFEKANIEELAKCVTKVFDIDWKIMEEYNRNKVRTLDKSVVNKKMNEIYSGINKLKV